MSTRIGWHFQAGVPGWAQGIVNADWNKVLDPPGNDPFPGRKTIGRTYVDDGASNEMVMRGAAGADTWFALQRQRYESAPWVAAWEGPNEPPVGTPEQRRALSAFTAKFGELMHGIGRKTVGLNLSVGWPDIGTAADLGPCLAACDYIGLHEYSAPTMQSNAGWYCLRYRRTVAEWRQAGYTVPPILITECGIDGGVIGRPRTGWKSYCQPDAYVEQLQWYLTEARKDGLVKGMTVFTSAPVGWQDFEVDESLSRKIAAMNAAQPEPEPQPGPGGTMKVYDHTGVEKDAAWLAANYDGCHVETVAGTKAFRIVEVRVTEGPASFTAEVRNEQGGPHASQPVAFSWPSLTQPAADLPDLSGCGAPKIWTVRGINQRTAANGLTGFGLGSAYGPLYQSWVISPSLPSDCIVGAGMKGGTNHRGPLRVIWQISGATPEPEPEPGTGDLKETNALLRELIAAVKAGFRL